MQYQTCPYCGAHLDFGERCDCRNEKKPLQDGNPESGKEISTTLFYQGRDNLSSPGRKEPQNETV